MRRVAALITGVVLVVVELFGMTRLVSPLDPEGLGYDLAWLLFMSAGLYMLLYGIGATGKRKPR